MTDVVRMKGGKRVSIQFKVVPMRLALYPQVMYQAPQHFRSSEKQATCEGCFARQSICLVISLRSGMSSVTLLHIRQQNNCSLSDKISVKHHNSLVVLIFFLFTILLQIQYQFHRKSKRPSEPNLFLNVSHSCRFRSRFDSL